MTDLVAMIVARLANDSRRTVQKITEELSVDHKDVVACQLGVAFGMLRDHHSVEDCLNIIEINLIQMGWRKTN